MRLLFISELWLRLWLVDIVTHAYDWNYDKNHGPESAAWPELCHSGREQSPVDVRLDEAEANCFELPLHLRGYNTSHGHVTAVNNGHSVVIEDLDAQHDIQVSSALLENSYELVNIHFHWGQTSAQGSEHRLNGKVFPLEMHLVHKKVSDDPTFEPLTDKDGLLVMSVLFEETGQDNQGLQPIIEQMKQAVNRGEAADGTKSELRLLSIFPPTPTGGAADHSFVHYKGSLTTPDCNEVVHWFVLAKPSHVSTNQLNEFRNDVRSSGGKVMHNFRPMQDMNEREFDMVRASCKVDVYAQLAEEIGGGKAGGAPPPPAPEPEPTTVEGSGTGASSGNVSQGAIDDILLQQPDDYADAELFADSYEEPTRGRDGPITNMTLKMNVSAAPEVVGRPQILLLVVLLGLLGWMG